MLCVSWIRTWRLILKQGPFYYGFKCHDTDFGIDGFVLFYAYKDEIEVGMLLLGMIIMIFNHDNDANHFYEFVQ